MQIVEKNDFITDRCRGKNVLDLGCVCHDLSEEQIKTGIWLHGAIKMTANKLIGFDFEKEEVEKLQKKGYNIHYANIEEINTYTKETFDVIVLGSVIEHLSNPGLMLDSIRKLCHDNTIIIISTINAWSPRYFVSAFVNEEERTCRPDHVTWYSHYVMEVLLKRHGFLISEKCFYNFYPLKITGIRPFFRIMIKRLFPVLSHGLIVVAKPGHV